MKLIGCDLKLMVWCHKLDININLCVFSQMIMYLIDLYQKNTNIVINIIGISTQIGSFVYIFNKSKALKFNKINKIKNINLAVLLLILYYYRSVVIISLIHC